MQYVGSQLIGSTAFDNTIEIPLIIIDFDIINIRFTFDYVNHGQKKNTSSMMLLKSDLMEIYDIEQNGYVEFHYNIENGLLKQVYQYLHSYYAFESIEILFFKNTSNAQTYDDSALLSRIDALEQLTNDNGNAEIVNALNSVKDELFKSNQLKKIDILGG
jgi:hypothetical protein